VSLVLWLVLPFSSPSTAFGQCQGACGDLTGNGFVSGADLSALLDLLYRNGALAFDPDCADVDGYDRLTIRDVLFVWDELWAHGFPLVCPSTFPALDPVPTPGCRLEHTGLVPPGAAQLRVQFRLAVPDVTRAVNLAVSFSVEGELPELDSATVGARWHPTWVWVNLNPNGAPPGSFTAGFVQPYGALDGNNELISVYISVSPAAYPRRLTAQFVELPPMIPDDSGAVKPVHHTMVLGLGDSSFPWPPMIPETPTCDVAHTGDVNLDLDLTAGDIVTTVNYVFKGGFQPYPCPAAADVNCSGQVTSSDIIALVNHVFKAGPAPCDVCSLIPVMWNCPDSW
jgi:hypothetical protein